MVNLKVEEQKDLFPKAILKISENEENIIRQTNEKDNLFKKFKTLKDGNINSSNNLKINNKYSKLSSNNRNVMGNIFTRITTYDAKEAGINFIDFDKHQEKLFNYFAGLAYKIDIEEGKSHIPKENYLNTDWYYVLVFPNPDYDKRVKYCNIEETNSLYDLFFFPDTSKTTFLKGQTSEKNVFNFVINDKINDNSNNNCLINKGGCFIQSKYY